MARRSTYSLAMAQRRLPALLRQAESGVRVGIARHGEIVAYLLSRHHLEGLLETMEILASPNARTAITEHRAGRTRFLPLSALDDRE